MEVQKFEMKDPSDLFLLIANLMADAAIKSKQQEENEEKTIAACNSYRGKRH